MITSKAHRKYFPASHPWNNKINGTHDKEPETPKQRQVRMPYRPLAEMQVHIYIAHRLESALRRDKEIEKCPYKDKTKRDAFDKTVPATSHGKKNIRDESKYGYHHQSAVNDRNGL